MKIIIKKLKNQLIIRFTDFQFNTLTKHVPMSIEEVELFENELSKKGPNLLKNIDLHVSAREGNISLSFVGQNSLIESPLYYLAEILQFLIDQSLLNPNEIENLSAFSRLIKDINEIFLNLKSKMAFINRDQEHLVDASDISEYETSKRALQESRLLKDFKSFYKELLSLKKLFKSLVKKNNLMQVMPEIIQYYLDEFATIKKYKSNLQNFSQFDERKKYLKSDNKLSHMIKCLVPASAENVKALLNTNTSMVRFVLKDHPVLRRHGIKRIAVYTSPTSIKCASNECIIEVTYIDHLNNVQKKFLQLNKHVLSLQALRKLLLAEGAYVDKMAVARGKGALGPAFFEGLHSYDSDMETDYAIIHSEIEKEIQTISKNSTQPIEIIFIGCGKGEEIKNVVQFLEKEGYKYIIYGMDLDEKNIQIAKQQPGLQSRPIYLTAGNANNFSDLITKLRSESGVEKQPTSIVISSGFLTRLVNKDSEEAFKIFKQVAHHVDTVIISGRTETLISARDAKSSGLKTTQRIFPTTGNSYRTLDRFETINFDNQIHQITQQMCHGEEPTICLKDHARPEQMLRELVKLGIDLRNVEIDLRGAYFESVDVLTELVKNSNVRITAFYNEAWLPQLYQSLPEKSHGNISKKVANTTLFYDSSAKHFVWERPKLSEKLMDRAEQYIANEKKSMP